MKQIIAMGGGGFSMEPNNQLLDQYILKQSGKVCPKICFLATTSGDSQDYIAHFYQFFEQQSCQPSHLSIMNTNDIESFLLAQDIIYVGGGNTKNMLMLWKEHEIDKILHKAWSQGIVLAGISAGAICWFEQGVTDSYGGDLAALQCLGFLRGSNCPHYDGEVVRRRSYHQLITRGEIQPGYALDDGVAIHFIEQNVQAIVSSRPHAKAYQVICDKQVTEIELKPTYLGAEWEE